MTEKILALVKKDIYRLILMMATLMTKEVANLHGGVLPRGKSPEAPVRT